jgi:hypothetical protein
MAFAIRVSCALLFLMWCGHAQAQFSQPPPDRPPPVCPVVSGQGGGLLSQNAKSGGTHCASLGNFRTFLHCKPPMWGPGSIVDCVAATEWFNGLQWVVVNPSTIVYDWAFIIDGQEYYLTSGGSDVWGMIAWNSDRYDAVYFDCGRSGEGYVRVTAAGKTDQVPFYCDPYAAYD